MVALVERLLLLLSVFISAFGYDSRLGFPLSSSALEISDSGPDPLLMRRQSSTARTDDNLVELEANTHEDKDPAEVKDPAALMADSQASEFSRQLEAARKKGDIVANEQLHTRTRTAAQRSLDKSLARLRKAEEMAQESIAALHQQSIALAARRTKAKPLWGAAFIQIDGGGDRASDTDDGISSDGSNLTWIQKSSALNSIAALAKQAAEEASAVSLTPKMPEALNYSVQANQLKHEAHEHIAKAMRLFPPIPASQMPKANGGAIAQLSSTSSSQDELDEEDEQDSADDGVIPTKAPTAQDLREQGLAHLQAAEDAIPVAPKALATPTAWEQVEKQANEALKLTQATPDSTAQSHTAQSQLQASAVQLSEVEPEQPTQLPLWMNDTALRIAAANEKPISFVDAPEEVTKNHNERVQNLQDASLILDEATQELDKEESLDKPPVPLSTGPSGADLLRNALSGEPRAPTAAEQLEQHLNLLQQPQLR